MTYTSQQLIDELKEKPEKKVYIWVDGDRYQISEIDFSNEDFIEINTKDECIVEAYIRSNKLENPEIHFTECQYENGDFKCDICQTNKTKEVFGLIFTNSSHIYHICSGCADAVSKIFDAPVRKRGLKNSELVKQVLIKMAINCTLPSDINELDSDIFSFLDNPQKRNNL